MNGMLAAAGTDGPTVSQPSEASTGVASRTDRDAHVRPAAANIPQDGLSAGEPDKGLAHGESPATDSPPSPAPAERPYRPDWKKGKK